MSASTSEEDRGLLGALQLSRSGQTEDRAKDDRSATCVRDRVVRSRKELADCLKSTGASASQFAGDATASGAPRRLRIVTASVTRLRRSGSARVGRLLDGIIATIQTVSSDEKIVQLLNLT